MEKVVSRIFDPFIILSLAFFLGALQSGLHGFLLLKFLVLFFVFIVVPPAILLWWAIKKHLVSNWDLSNRKQRVKVFVYLTALLLVDQFIVQIIGNNYLYHFFLSLVLFFLGFFVITLFWKISGHVSAVTLLCLFIITWYGINWLPLFLFVPIVAWARITSKNHTTGQTIVGFLYTIGVFKLLTQIFDFSRP